MLRHATLGGSTTMSLKEKISRSAVAFLTVRAQNLPLQFYTSTLNGLVDLVEDEIIPTPIPMEVKYFRHSYSIGGEFFWSCPPLVFSKIVMFGYKRIIGPFGKYCLTSD